MSSEYLRPTQAAELLGVSVSMLAKRRMAGLAPKFIKVGGAVRYERTELIQFMAANTRPLAG
jgi:hypothetical protein